jgi:tetratricopeptide (TPR) repeat protein
MKEMTIGLGWLLVAAWLASGLGMPRAHAQSSDVEAARAAYLRAALAAEELRWSDALEGFREAYTLSGAPPALLNVGLSLRALGRYVEARDAFEGLERAAPEYAREQNVQELLAHARAQVAVLTVRGLVGPSQLRLDGRLVAPAEGEGPRSLAVDPGPHTVEVIREGFAPFIWERDMAPGENASVRIEYRAVLPEGRSRERTRRLAGGLSAAVVVVAVVVGAVFLQRGAQLDPATDNHLRFP